MPQRLLSLTSNTWNNIRRNVPWHTAPETGLHKALLGVGCSASRPAWNQGLAGDGASLLQWHMLCKTRVKAFQQGCTQLLAALAAAALPARCSFTPHLSTLRLSLHSKAELKWLQHQHGVSGSTGEEGNKEQCSLATCFLCGSPGQSQEITPKHQGWMVRLTTATCRWAARARRAAQVPAEQGWCWARFPRICCSHKNCRASLSTGRAGLGQGSAACCTCGHRRGNSPASPSTARTDMAPLPGQTLLLAA